MLSTKPLDIRPDHAEIVYKILKDNLEEGNYVFAFGSRANWTAKQSSDLDLAMDGFGMKLDKKIKSNLEDAFEESDLPYKVDVVDLNSVSESFKEAIQDQLVRVLWDWKTYQSGEIVEFVNNKVSIDLVDVRTYISTDNMLPDCAGIEEAKFLPNAKTVNGFIVNDVLFSNIRTYFRKVWLATFSGSCSPDVLVIRSKNFDLLDQKFLFRIVCSDEFIEYSVRTAKGVKMPRGDKDALKLMSITLPPLPEQKRIAEILSSLDNKIEINKQINKTLEEMAEALFKSWFIDFDPVRVKKAALEAGAGEEEANLAVMKFISSKTDEELEKFQNDYPEKSRELEDVAKLFPAEFQDSELGEVPLGWRVGKLSEVAEFLNGIALQKFPPENDRDYLPVIKIRELKAGITSQTDKASKNIDLKYVINDGDILFSWSGSLEVVIWKYGKGALNQHLFKVTSNHYPKWFYYFWTVHHLPKFRAIASHKATTMGHIQRHHLDEAQVIIPDDEILRKLDKQTSLILEKIMLINQEIQSLALNHDQLLPRLMRGEITVRNY